MNPLGELSVQSDRLPQTRTSLVLVPPFICKSLQINILLIQNKIGLFSVFISQPDDVSLSMLVDKVSLDL